MSKFIDKLSWLGIIPIAIAIIIYLYNTQVLEKQTENFEEIMFQKLMDLKLPPKTRLVKTERYHKSTSAIVISDYRSTFSNEGIIRHYKEALKNDGWELCCDEKNTNDNPPYITVNLQNRDFTAAVNIFIPKEKSIERKFSVSIAYGLGEGCRKCNY